MASQQQPMEQRGEVGALAGQGEGLPRQGKVAGEVWWRARLEQYRRPVLFLWNALTFDPNDGLAPAGLALWVTVHGLLLAVSTLEGSLLYLLGNVLLMTALAYLLISVALKYGSIRLYPEWSEEHQRQFLAVCRHVDLTENLLSTVISRVAEMRKSEPKTFYGIGLLVVFMLGRVGDRVPSLYIAQIIASSVLLLPLALQHNWLTPSVFDSLTATLWKAARDLWAGLTTAVSVIWQRAQNFAAQRQQARSHRTQ